MTVTDTAHGIHNYSSASRPALRRFIPADIKQAMQTPRRIVVRLPPEVLSLATETKRGNHDLPRIFSAHALSAVKLSATFADVNKDGDLRWRNPRAPLFTQPAEEGQHAVTSCKQGGCITDARVWVCKYIASRARARYTGGYKKGEVVTRFWGSTTKDTAEAQHNRQLSDTIDDREADRENDGSWTSSGK